MFKPEPNPSKTSLFGKPFRVAPQQVYGQPDWDLIFKAFLDVARVIKQDRESVGFLEQNETLIGAGVGVEFNFSRNVNLGIDWGFALREAGNVDDGSSQVHIITTILY